MPNGIESLAEAREYHVIFIVLFGPADVKNSQLRRVQNMSFMNKIIHLSKTVRVARGRRLIKAPLVDGSGMFLGFPDSAEHPLQLALEIHQRLNHYNATRSAETRLGVRLGLHTGRILKIKDVKGKDNFFGPGIPMARC